MTRSALASVPLARELVKSTTTPTRVMECDYCVSYNTFDVSVLVIGK